MVMKMNKKFWTNIIGITLIIIALIPNSIIPNIVPAPKPSINLDINKPTEDILQIVKPIDLLVTDHDDRTKLAVFNYVFSKRASKYDISSQKLQDLYVLAAKNYFKDSIKNKYNNLDELIKQLFIKSVGESEHIVSKDEKVYVENLFGGLSWSLIK
jgi:hypothetical protein